MAGSYKPAWAVWVTGSRHWLPASRVEEELSAFPKGTIVLHGQAGGADMQADRAAENLGMYRCRVPYYGTAGKAGGPLRNDVLCRMLVGLRSTGLLVHVLAFGDDRGTRDSVGRARKAGIDVTWIDGPSEEVA